MSSSQVILGELLSSSARLRFPGQTHAQPSTPVRQQKPSKRHTGTSHTVSLQGVTPDVKPPRSPEYLFSPRNPLPTRHLRSHYPAKIVGMLVMPNQLPYK
jgi:hypothetical protein